MWLALGLATGLALMPVPAIRAAQNGQVDCGRGSSPGFNLGPEETCFADAFAECRPATLELISESVRTRDGTSHRDRQDILRHEILGPREPYCDVRFEWLTHPDPAYPGKSMVCPKVASHPWEAARLDITRCDGPLFDAIAGVGDPESEFEIGRGGMQELSRTSEPGGAGHLVLYQPLRAELLRREGDAYLVAVEHTQATACGRQELHLPLRKAYICGQGAWLLVINAERSNDDRVVFVVQHALAF
jgi:hypothetical protein